MSQPILSTADELMPNILFIVGTDNSGCQDSHRLQLQSAVCVVGELVLSLDPSFHETLARTSWVRQRYIHQSSKK